MLPKTLLHNLFNPFIMSYKKLIIFSHGKNSGPDSEKIKILRDSVKHKNYNIISVDYRRCKDARERVILLRNVINNHKLQPIILVGSSMGGYLSTVLSAEFKVSGLFLMCPALYFPRSEYEVQSYKPKCNKIEIIHGWADDVVPYDSSVRFANQTKAVLNLINDNHRLSGSYSFIIHRFNLFLKNVN